MSNNIYRTLLTICLNNFITYMVCWFTNNKILDFINVIFNYIFLLNCLHDNLNFELKTSGLINGIKHSMYLLFFMTNSVYLLKLI